jgi:molybdenum cofactor biosynthesis enzyme MoaA
MKFAPLREKRQELYNIENYKLIPFTFEEKVKHVYSNVNLSIFVTDYCNANCKFCVAQLRYENRTQVFQKSSIKNDLEYYNRLDYILDYLKPINPSISLTGGEPTKSKRLPTILKIINNHGYRKRTLTTNGSGLLDTVEGKRMIDHIITNNFSHLNISKAHYNEDQNKKLMRYELGYCSNKDIETIATISLLNGLRPRMSCLLLKEGINSLEEIIRYIEYYQNLGIDNVIFRELMDYDKSKMSNSEKIIYNENNKVFLNNIWKLVDQDKRFTPIRNLLGYYYYVEVYKFDKVDVCSEGANLVKLYKEKEKHKDIVYEMILHANGNLNGSWVDKEDILLPYKSK